VTFFQIALSRCSDAARNLLGEDFQGILNSDRYAAYNWSNRPRGDRIIHTLIQQRHYSDQKYPEIDNLQLGLLATAQ
jgi:hypothetical protein